MNGAGGGGGSAKGGWDLQMEFLSISVVMDASIYTGAGTFCFLDFRPLNGLAVEGFR